MQVVVNPFIWSRLQRSGQPVPFMFEQFKRDERRAPVALAITAPELGPVHVSSSKQSLQEIQHRISSLVEQLLGSKVGQGKMHINLIEQSQIHGMVASSL